MQDDSLLQQRIIQPKMPVNPGVEKSWFREKCPKKKKKKVSFPTCTDPKGGAKFTTSTETSILREFLPY